MGQTVVNAIPELYKASFDDKSNLVRTAAITALENLAPKLGYHTTEDLLKANKINLSKYK